MKDESVTAHATFRDFGGPQVLASGLILGFKDGGDGGVVKNHEGIAKANGFSNAFRLQGLVQESTVHFMQDEEGRKLVAQLAGQRLKPPR